MLTNCLNCNAPVVLDLKYCPYCDTPYQKAKKEQSLFPLNIECPQCHKFFEGTEDTVEWSIELAGPDIVTELGLAYQCQHCGCRIESETYYRPGKKEIKASDLINAHMSRPEPKEFFPRFCTVSDYGYGPDYRYGRWWGDM